VLRRLARDAAERTRDVEGLVDRFEGDEGCAPELNLRVLPAQAGRQGLSAQGIADQVAGAFIGEVASQLRRPDHLEPVRVRVRQPAGDEPPAPEILERATLASAGAPLPLRAVVEPERACPPATLLRHNQRNMVHLTARLSGTSLGEAVRQVRARLAGWQLPVGYSWELGGLYQQQQESFRSLLLVLALALAAVVAVLLFQLRSWARSLSVLLAAPLGLAGAAATLLVTGTALNVSSMMGAILLVGLVVKNGILLLDHALWAEEEGTPIGDALVAAGRARLRPILMTTLATLAALLPLVSGLGAGGELHRPLAVVVVGGLSFSTLATLFVVPAAALLLARLRTARRIP
jgi:multidrug efflux pump subunit AcrB